MGVPLVTLRILGQAAEFLAFVIFARRLGTTEFGQLSMAFLVCRYAGMVADWGAAVRGVRDVAGDRSAGQIAALLKRRYAVTTVLTGAYVVGCVATGWLSLVPVAMVIVSRGLSRDWLALGRHLGGRAGMPAVAQGATAALLATTVNSLGWAAIVLALAYGTSTMMSLALNRVPDRPPSAGVKVDAWLVVSLLADQVTLSSDVLLLGFLASASEAGVYAAVYRIPNAWLSVIGLVVLSRLPSVTHALTRGEATISQLWRRASRLGALIAVVIVATIPIAVLLVVPLFGEEYAAGRAPLAILLLATAAIAAGSSLHPLVVALNEDRRLAAASVGVALLNVSGNVAVIPAHGMVGAAVVTLVSEVILGLAFAVIVGRRARQAVHR
ncbi:MAG: hypothetical protein IPM45_17525 [Acidimicrobiales bacterium]|nr:hypothetical protein [Acidimicrobiales bacterium]